jgi:hypothetical protein
MIPDIKEDLCIKVNNILLQYYNNSLLDETLKLKMGILYFIFNNNEYIHCPIKEVLPSGLIKFGNCTHFKPILNNFRNRQKLSTHKYRYHFNCNKNIINIIIINGYYYCKLLLVYYY